jgi:hypothetical protein
MIMNIENGQRYRTSRREEGGGSQSDGAWSSRDDGDSEWNRDVSVAWSQGIKSSQDNKAGAEEGVEVLDVPTRPGEAPLKNIFQRLLYTRRDDDKSIITSQSDVVHSLDVEDGNEDFYIRGFWCCICQKPFHRVTLALLEWFWLFMELGSLLAEKSRVDTDVSFLMQQENNMLCESGVVTNGDKWFPIQNISAS